MAVYFLIKQICNGNIKFTYTKCGYLIESHNDAIDIAQKMEKEQIINAWNSNEGIDAEDYYQITYEHPDPSDDEIYNNFNHEGGIKYE